MSASTSSTPPLASLLRRAGADAAEGVRVAGPAVVVAFDATRATVDAQPLLRHTLPDGRSVSDPALSGVPVVYPGSARSRVRFPLASGDTVLLVHLDRAADSWILSLQLPEAVAPREHSHPERRSHDYSDVVAIPMSTCAPSARPVGDFLEVVTDGEVRVHDGTASEAVALATLADLASLKSAINSWTPVTGDGGAALKTVLSALFAGPPTWPAGTSVLKGK